MPSALQEVLEFITDNRRPDSFPTEPIGGGNPYHRCRSCGRSVPEISSRGHYGNCSWNEGENQIQRISRLMQFALEEVFQQGVMKERHRVQAYNVAGAAIAKDGTCVKLQYENTRLGMTARELDLTTKCARIWDHINDRNTNSPPQSWWNTLYDLLEDHDL